jgi:hypothetical protein
LVDSHALLTAFLLKLLDEIEHPLLIELELGTKDHLRLWILHCLELQVDIVLHAIRNQLEDKLIIEQALMNNRLVTETNVENSRTLFLILLFGSLVSRFLLRLSLLSIVSHVVVDICLYKLCMAHGSVSNGELDLGV